MKGIVERGGKWVRCKLPGAGGAGNGAGRDVPPVVDSCNG
jgi:hypothetical protein